MWDTIRGDLGHHPLLTTLCEVLSIHRYLEIGVQEGKSLAAALDARTIEALTLIDPWGDTHGGTNRGSHVHIDQLLQARKYQGSVTYYDEPSYQALPWLIAQGVEWDLVHIDGDHTMAGCLFDLACCRVATPIMVVHDAHYPDVKLAIEAFQQVIPGWRARLFTEALGTMVLVREGR